MLGIAGDDGEPWRRDRGHGAFGTRIDGERR
jgi:hypothetical protein